MNKRDSYTSADAMPVKLAQCPDVLQSIQIKKVIPAVHAQLILTNRCNLNCHFCSCAEDDRRTEMPYVMALELIDILKECGTKAVTITGGGEPLLHPYFKDIVCAFYIAGIQVGLVTNGLLLNKLDEGTLNRITWIRISHSSDRTFNSDYKFRLFEAVNKGYSVDWAFSFVVTNETQTEDVIPIIQFANQSNFTHVRLVADLFHPEEVDMELLREEIEKEVADHLVVYQPRQNPERGGSCYMGLLKPLIGPNGMIYACCGVQYALKTPSKRLPMELCLGSAYRLKEMTEETKPLDGSICVRCYYGQYNRTLQNMLSFAENVNHKDFV